MCACVHACMCACVCACVCERKQTCALVCACVCACVCVYARVHVHACACVRESIWLTSSKAPNFCFFFLAMFFLVPVRSSLPHTNNNKKRTKYLCVRERAPGWHRASRWRERACCANVQCSRHFQEAAQSGDASPFPAPLPTEIVCVCVYTYIVCERVCVYV